MGFFRNLFVNFLLLFGSHEAESGCFLSLDSNSFGSPPPVFIQNGRYLNPDPKTGLIKFGRSETVTAACPGNSNYVVLNNQTSGYDVVEAHCIVNQTFGIKRWIGQFKNVECKTQPWFTAEETAEECNGGSRIYRIGYKVNEKFYKLYESCFDKNLLLTHYVKHQITPESVFMQKGLKRPSFIEGNLFSKKRMSKLYKVENQRKRLDDILGKNMSELYISNKQRLTRGHLAARADYTLHAQTRATFQYINTSPQWFRGNSGDWAALEEALRRRIHALGINVTVFSGTYGVMTLPDAKGAMREIYLDVDENNNGVVPVPMYFYKVVYDPQQKTATAFISINSSFYNQTFTDDLTFCNDICEGSQRNKKLSWLTWRPKDGTFSFCCEYHEFAAIVDYLPLKDITGTFY